MEGERGGEEGGGSAALICKDLFAYLGVHSVSGGGEYELAAGSRKQKKGEQKSSERAREKKRKVREREGMK